MAYSTISVLLLLRVLSISNTTHSLNSLYICFISLFSTSHDLTNTHIPPEPRHPLPAGLILSKLTNPGNMSLNWLRSICQVRFNVIISKPSQYDTKV